MEAIEQMVGQVVDHLGSAANSGTVSGDPIKLGDVTLVILSMVTIGMGAGGGEGEGKGQAGKRTSPKGQAPGSGLGEGAGGVVRVRPAAVVVFSAEGVKVLPIPDEPGVMDKVVGRVPEVMDMVERARQTFSQPAR